MMRLRKGKVNNLLQIRGNETRNVSPIRENIESERMKLHTYDQDEQLYICTCF